jgi:hypothetical protein
MPANTLEPWAHFFMTAAGVAAILAGLIVVAVAVSLHRILKYPHLPPRVRATFSNLMLVVMTTLLGLVPQPISAFAAEVVVFCAIGWTIVIACQREIVEHHFKAGRPAAELMIGLPGAHAAILGFVAGSVLLWTANGHGLYWIMAGVVITLFSTMMNIWVFMVETMR